MFYPRLDISKGWTPDADATAAQPGGYLRADNLTLTQAGILALRMGSRTLYTLSGGACHSLRTELLGSTRYRMAGVGDFIYANGVFLTSVGGSGDVAFGAALGQILFARGTSKKKYDGSTLRNWGISMTGAKPTVAAQAQDKKTFATGALAEAPAFVVNEDDGSGATFGPDHAGNANSAIQVKSSPTTGRAVFTKTYAAATDFTVYDGGTVGIESDLVSLYVNIGGVPQNFLSLDLQFDVSDGSFQTDYYTTRWNGDAGNGAGDPTPGGTGGQGAPDNTPGSGTGGTGPDVPDQAANRYAAQKSARSAVIRAAVPRHGTPKSPGGLNFNWVQLFAARSLFDRIGSTGGKDWKTMRAVRLIFRMTTTQQVDVETIKIAGGRLLGAYKWAYQLVNDNGTYVAKSAPSVFSDELTLASQGADVTVPADSSRDTQANFAWVFRMGGVMDAFYRVATKAISGTGSTTISDQLSDADAMITNIPLETDNLTPPDNIIDVEGPYYDRTFVLTSDGFLWPSKRLNPDSYASSQAIRVCGADETAYWVEKAFGGLYIGTSKEIYRLEGDGAELPDGTVNFVKRPINIDHAPISAALAREGNLIVYLASDGWRAFSGEASQILTGDTGLLYRGFTRHEVSPVNLAGRFRAAISKGEFVAVTPEGSSSADSTVLYRHAPDVGMRWYRHVYPNALQVIYREPDGTLLAGESGGIVRIIDAADNGLDDSAEIPVTLWTREDDFDQPFHRKEATGLHLLVDTGGERLTIETRIDEASTWHPVPTPFSLVTTTLALTMMDATAIGRARQVQLRMTGSFSRFRYGGYGLTAILRPLGVKVWDSGPIDAQAQDDVWIRHLYFKVNASVDFVVKIWLDGQLRTTVPVAITDAQVNQDAIIPIDIGRNIVGRQPQITIHSSGEFLPYWLDVFFRGSGRVTAKQRQRVQAA